MDLVKKKYELIDMLENLLFSKITAVEISTFVWDIIDYYTDLKKEITLPVSIDEQIFWYAIWQIQHFADDNHLPRYL